MPVVVAATRCGACRTAAAASCSPTWPRSSGAQRSRASSCVGRRACRRARSSRAASGIHCDGSAQIDAPYSDTDEVERRVGQRHVLAGASTSGNSIPVSGCIRRAVSSCAGVGSTPTGRAPRRASHAEKYAVPQPSSTTSSPSTSRARRARASGTPQMPHGSRRPPTPRAHARPCTPRSSASRPRGCRDGVGSDELIGGEPERDLALGGLRRVGAVHEVVGHRHREVAADRARLGVGRIRRADRLRIVAIAPSPSTTSAQVGPDVMKSTSSPKNGFSCARRSASRRARGSR